MITEPATDVNKKGGHSATKSQGMEKRRNWREEDRWWRQKLGTGSHFFFRNVLTCNLEAATCDVKGDIGSKTTCDFNSLKKNGVKSLFLTMEKKKGCQALKNESSLLTSGLVSYPVEGTISCPLQISHL